MSGLAITFTTDHGRLRVPARLLLALNHPNSGDRTLRVLVGVKHLVHADLADQRRYFVGAGLLANLKGHELRAILWSWNK